MATIKSYTDLQQSKKLAKILPIESADMWHHGFFNPSRMCKIEYNPPAPYHSVTHQWDCPCWSLAALLSVLKERHDCNTLEIFTNKAQLYTITTSYYKDASWKNISIISDNPVDACVEMIIRLHELNKM